MKTKTACRNVILLLMVSIFITPGFSQHNNNFTADPTTNTYVDFGRVLDISAMDTIWDSDEISITMWMRWTDKTHPDVGNWTNLLTIS